MSTKFVSRLLLVIGILAVCFVSSPAQISEVSETESPQSPDESSGEFIYSAGGSGTITLCEASSVKREITSMIFSGNEFTELTLFIDEKVILECQFSKYNMFNTWNRNDGAGIIIKPGETVKFRAKSSTAQVTIIGFEY